MDVNSPNPSEVNGNYEVCVRMDLQSMLADLSLMVSGMVR